MNGVSYWHLDKDILNAMKDAGFISLNLSLVSRERNSDLLRPMDVERFKEISWLAYEMVSMYRLLYSRASRAVH
jgi:hypothetical protein